MQMIDLQTRLEKIFLVSAQGGSPEELLPENVGEIDVTWSPDGTKLAFGRISSLNTGTIDIPWLDMKTHQVSTFPGSKGLFSTLPVSRWPVFVGDPGWGISSTHALCFRTQTWSVWLAGIDNINYPYWSSDSRYFYFDDFGLENPQCHRVKVLENRPEDRFSLNSLSRFFGCWGSWGGQAPDDSRLFVHDASTQDIYAPDVDLPWQVARRRTRAIQK
jgi:hypothetical protein